MTRRASSLDWKAILGIALGIGLFAYSLRDVSIAEVLHEIRRADPVLFLASIVVVTAPMVVRAWRWKPLLDPVRSGTRFRSRFQATMIGFMVNNLLPARVGEVARAFVLSRMEGVPIVASVGSLVLERLFDGLVVVGLLFLAMSLPSFPDVGSLGGADIGGAASAVIWIMVALCTVLLAMVLLPARVVAVVSWGAARVLPASFRRPLIEGLEAFLGGLGALRRPRLLASVGFWSVWVWLVSGLAFWLGFRAFGIETPFGAALFLQSLIALAVALPSAPGFFGLWEAAALLGLHEIWGIEKSKALGFAIGFHLGGFLSVTLLGLFYAWRLGFSLREVGRSETATAHGPGEVAVALGTETLP